MSKKTTVNPLTKRTCTIEYAIPRPFDNIDVIFRLHLRQLIDDYVNQLPSDDLLEAIMRQELEQL